MPARKPAKSGPRRAPFVSIYREPGRRQLPQVLLQPGQGLFWDRRFYLSLASEHREAIRVEPLGQAGFARLKREFPSVAAISLPSAAAASLPSLWAGDQLIAVACLSSAEPRLLGPEIEGRPALAAEFAPQHVRSICGHQSG